MMLAEPQQEIFPIEGIENEGFGEKVNDDTQIAEALPVVSDLQEVAVAVPETTEAILDALQQHEREFLEQEQNRKDKIKKSLLDRTKVPASYYTNSVKEALILQYMYSNLTSENFDRQYTQLYPGRKDLMLIRPNEFGTNV